MTSILSDNTAEPDLTQQIETSIVGVQSVGARTMGMPKRGREAIESAILTALAIAERELSDARKRLAGLLQNLKEHAELDSTYVADRRDMNYSPTSYVIEVSDIVAQHSKMKSLEDRMKYLNHIMGDLLAAV
jgi:hypothetical protein